MYSRTIDNKVLTLSASGWTYYSTFVLYDYETESLWYPISGTSGLTCISGEYVDRKLEELTSTQTSWSKWKLKNPDTKYMKFKQFVK